MLAISRCSHGPLHQPGVVLLLDAERLGGVDLRRPGHILRLVHRHRRQLRQTGGDRLHQLPGTLVVGGGGHGHERVARLLHMDTESVQLGRVCQQVRLVGHHDLGPCGKLGAVLPQLLIDGVKVRYGVPALAAGDIHQMHQQTAAVDVPQEVVAQPGPLAGAPSMMPGISASTKETPSST